MFDWLTEFVSASAWTYPIVLGVVALDAFFPVVPSETIVITAGVAATRGDLVVWLILLSAFVGAFRATTSPIALADTAARPREGCSRAAARSDCSTGRGASCASADRS